MSTSDKKEIGFLRGQRNRAEKLAIEQAQEVGRLQERLAQAKANADALAKEADDKDRALDVAKWQAQVNLDLWQERLDQVLKLEEENERLESALEDAQAQIQEVADISVEGESFPYRPVRCRRRRCVRCAEASRTVLRRQGLEEAA